MTPFEVERTAGHLARQPTAREHDRGPSSLGYGRMGGALVRGPREPNSPSGVLRRASSAGNGIHCVGSSSGPPRAASLSLSHRPRPHPTLRRATQSTPLRTGPGALRRSLCAGPGALRPGGSCLGGGCRELLELLPVEDGRFHVDLPKEGVELPPVLKLVFHHVQDRAPHPRREILIPPRGQFGNEEGPVQVLVRESGGTCSAPPMSHGPS